MQWRKQNITVYVLAFLGVVGVVMTSARADTAEQANRPYFKGPMSTCVSSRNATVYPCVSLSPSGYRSNYRASVVAPVAGFELPLDTGAHDMHWLARLRNSEFMNSALRLSSELQGMKMDFSLGRSGAAMNMNLGPLKLNVLNEAGRLSESRYFLDVERSW